MRRLMNNRWKHDHIPLTREEWRSIGFWLGLCLLAGLIVAYCL
jgi:hypothetical protein